MLAFHRGLQAGRSAAPVKARALQQTALDVMRTPEYHHPFYSAAFVMIGDALSPRP